LVTVYRAVSPRLQRIVDVVSQLRIYGYTFLLDRTVYCPHMKTILLDSVKCKNAEVYQYAIAFNPEVDSLRMRFKLLDM